MFPFLFQSFLKRAGYLHRKIVLTELRRLYEALSATEKAALRHSDAQDLLAQAVANCPSLGAEQRELFTLFKVDSFYDLSRAYTREDQKLMKRGKWDPNNLALITNRAKILLEWIDPSDLNETDRSWRKEILWFWYHHATSHTRSRIEAQFYADQALELQGLDHPNRITRLLWFLAHDRVAVAERWMRERPPGADPIEHQNGLALIDEYKKRKFWT